MPRRLLVLSLFALPLTGCVAQDKYNALRIEKEQLAERVASSEAAEARSRAQAETWKSQHEALLARMNDEGQLAGLNAKEKAELEKELAVLREKYDQAIRREPVVIGGTALPAELSNALAAFARENPDLVEFDAARGIVKFKSDVTFAKGSAELTPNAKSAAGRLAAILNSPAAAPYEFLVAGHTDNTPVNNPATKLAGHKDNFYLSSHRALSVGHELMSHSVNPRRFGAVGYGDQRPIASNATAEGQARNRRVEVILLPNTVGNSSPGVASDGNRRTAPPVRTNDLNKDINLPERGPVSVPDRTPILNK